MKKLLILSVLILAILATNAQEPLASKKGVKKEKKSERKALRKLEGTEVSYQSKQAFIADFGDVPGASWRRSANFDEVTFTKNGVAQTAYYDADSKLVGTVTEKTFSDLPARARDYITLKYPNYNIDKIIMFDDNEENDTDMIMYGYQIDDQDNYFAELTRNNQTIVLQITPEGMVSFFTQLKK